MYLLYLDESGNPEGPEDTHFVVGGLAVFERVTYWLNRGVEDVQARYWPGRPPIEFHASHIRAGRGFWRSVQEPVRFAESAYQPSAKTWVRGFRDLGTQWGILRNLSDAPYFAPAKENRLLQLADFIAHATYLLYERHNPTLARDIVRRFDDKDGVLHGLAHVSQNRGSACLCPACVSRRTPGEIGPWV